MTDDRLREALEETLLPYLVIGLGIPEETFATIIRGASARLGAFWGLAAADSRPAEPEGLPQFVIDMENDIADEPVDHRMWVGVGFIREVIRLLRAADSRPAELDAATRKIVKRHIEQARYKGQPVPNKSNHYTGSITFCASCHQPWPCDASILAARLSTEADQAETPR